VATATPSPSELTAEAVPSAREVLSIWSRHLFTLLIPGNALLFLWTGPHAWGTGLLFILPIAVAQYFDRRDYVERRAPLAAMPAWPFDGLVYLLAAVQIVNVYLLVALFSQQSLFSLDFLASIIVVGASSGFSIITAHELIHRRPAWEQNLGRLLLCSVLYEHFYTEHLRGHHLRVGTAEDPATARFGESFHRFYVRTVPAQFKSAWRLEKKRLGDESMSNLDPRMLRHRCLHGLIVGWGAVIAAGLAFGLAAAVVFILQGFFASRLLEIVNYFEHWGLTREAKQVRPRDSWDTHSWFTYYALVGLSRHGDHHAAASRPFQQLRICDESPTLPSGYIGMILLVILNNARFQKLMTEELRRTRLGPFRGDAADVVGRGASLDDGALRV
jgi:alkane 1-monooxygenase